ncbi:MAG: hypothetical protein LBO04_02510 [Spirochaetaceae bacterium]|jgi:hypothetical protein|nr:hypothetical protein [Spirochaetaceae bacterium]
MQSYEIPLHPVLEVSIGGSVVEKRPSSFKLATQRGFHSVVSRLLYPADSEVGASGDDITVSLASDDRTDLYFTGKVYSADINGSYRELLLTDGYKKLCDTDFTAAYRKEKAGTILDDILGAAGISETAITIPEVEMARFSTQTVSARICIDLLADALKGHGAEGLLYFFDEKDVFHFGTPDDTGKNEGEVFAFETGKNIVRKGAGFIEVLPRPVRHTQNLTVDGKEYQTIRTDLTVSRGISRLTLYLKEGA